MTDDVIDESAPVPSIRGRRIDMLDVMAALESPDPEEQFYEEWKLSDEQIEAAVEYVEEHRDELEEVE